MIGIPRKLAAASVMVAVLLLGPAATTVPNTSPEVTMGTAAEAEQAPPAVAVTLAVPAPAPAAATLPWITAESLVPAAPGDIDKPYSGVLAAPATDGLAVHATPGGEPFGLLPARVVASDGSDRGWMPVVGPADGEWLEVLLPARRNLPSSGRPVNGATGFVRTSDVLTKASAVTVEVDLANKTVRVADAGAIQARYPVSISGGEETARGRSFVMGRYATTISQRCSAQPMLILSAQSEGTDGYFDQVTAVQGVHAFSDHCRTISGYTQATPGCIIISEADMPRLLAIVPDGTPVTVR